MTTQVNGRLQEIIRFADALGWIRNPMNSDYPLMQLSEVEKCMIAMNDETYYNRMKQWAIEAGLK